MGYFYFAQRYCPGSKDKKKKKGSTYVCLFETRATYSLVRDPRPQHTRCCWRTVARYLTPPNKPLPSNPRTQHGNYSTGCCSKTMTSTGTLFRSAMRAHRLPSQVQGFFWSSSRPVTTVARPRQCQTPLANNPRSRMNSTVVETSPDTASPFPFPHAPLVDSHPDATATATARSPRQILLDAAAATTPRNNWTRKEVSVMYHQPLLELAHQAVSITGIGSGEPLFS